MNQLINYLRKYEDISAEEEKELQLLCNIKVVNKNEYFLQQGEKCKYIAFLKKGVFRYFYTTEEGDEVNNEFILSEGFISDFISFTTHSESQVSIQALEKSEIIYLNLSHSEAGSIINKLKKISVKYINSVCLPVLLDYQILLSERPDLRYVHLLKKYPEYIERIPQKYLASYLRLRTETISRIKRKLVDLNQFIS